MPVPGTAPIFYKGQADFGCYKTREYSVWLDNPTKRYETIVAGDGICEFDHVDWNDTATANNTVAPLGKWQYFVGVIDRVKHTAKIYLDGKLKTNEVDGYSTFNNNNSDLKIGYGAEGYSYFQGALDEIRLYNRALSATEVSALYSLVKPVGATLQGFNSYSATCTNTTTGKIVTVPVSVNPTFDCEKAGLVVNRKDNVTLTINGNAH